MNAIKHLNIGLKISLTVGLALLLAVGAGLFGIYKIDASLGTYGKILKTDMAQETATQRLMVDFKTQVQEWKNTLLRGKDAQQLEKYWTAFQKNEAEVAASARKLQEALPPGDARELAVKFGQAHTEMGIGYRKGMDAFKAANFDASAGDKAVKGMDRAPAELLDQLGKKIEAQVAHAIAAADQDRQRATVASLALMLAVCVLGGVLAWRMGQTITRPINEAVKIARTVAAGDLSSTIDISSHDETGKLLLALKAMNESLTDIVSSVRGSAQSIATGSAEIATGNADLSQRTEEQASNLQMTASSMERLTGTVKHNAEIASQASQLAASASAAATKGGSVVEQVVQTMQDIATSSRKINDIIGTIDGIAFQTNILALNAAVEAARAGEQGRGFAVVAGEVRSLAQRSAEAAKEIKNLIGASVETVEAGSRLVGDAGQSMQDIVNQVQRVTDLIAEISAAGHEQSQGIAQVGDAVNQLDQVTQQNAALVEESAAAADSLSHQAARLAEVVNVFKLGRDRGHAQRVEPSPPTAAAARTAATVLTAMKNPPAKRVSDVKPEPSNAAAASGNWETF